MVNYWFNIPYLSRWFGASTILENVVLSTIVTALMSTVFAPLWRGTWMRITKAQVGSTAGEHGCPLAVRVALNTRAAGSGERSQNAFDSMGKHRNLSIFQWRLLFFVGRMSRGFETYGPHCAVSLFLPVGLSTNGAIFLGQRCSLS